jgi:hypothetical protein
MRDVLRGEITAARGEHEFTIDLDDGYGVGWQVGDVVEVRRVNESQKDAKRLPSREALDAAWDQAMQNPAFRERWGRYDEG